MKIRHTVPEGIEERMRLRTLLIAFAEGKKLIPPVGLRMLESLAEEFIAQNGLDKELLNWLMVEIHNCVWMPYVACIPYDRRLLLLPKCLRDSKECRGEMDEVGLLCHKCGKCRIPGMEDKAEELGVMSMVAEGFTSVIELIENQVVDAVIGVSCLDSLEKAFPLLVNHAVPGVAIVLNSDGCIDTTVDEEYVKEIMTRKSDEHVSMINFESVKEEVKGWFKPQNSKPHNLTTLQPCNLKTSTPHDLALKWLNGDGKRWRPFLLTAVYKALTGEENTPDEVMKAAIAVECFHKASLVHDDIQDKDMVRYGKPTVNAVHGDAIAINIGDMLLGEGYRLLAECEHKELVAAIAKAHVSLCEGQGAELAWTAAFRLQSESGANALPLTREFVLDIFRNKTVPAFGVALELGLICADSNDLALKGILSEYSEAIGIAYQMRDDLDDYVEDNEKAHRPSIVLAVKTEHEDWKKDEIVCEVERMIAEYTRKAQDIVEKIEIVELKRLLMLVNGKILG